jgi:hypothetical protein
MNEINETVNESIEVSSERVDDIPLLLAEMERLGIAEVLVDRPPRGLDHRRQCGRLAFGGRRATGNPKDFPMPELSVDHWPAGE